MTSTPPDPEPASESRPEPASGPVPDLAGGVGLVGDLHGLIARLDELAVVEVGALGSVEQAQCVELIEQAQRRVAALQARVVGRVESDGTWGLGGYRSLGTWMQARTGGSRGRASRQVRHARALRDHLPQVAGALAQGRVGEDHVSSFARHGLASEELAERIADPGVQGMLVGFAQKHDAAAFDSIIKRWAIRNDPDGADRRWKDPTVREHIGVLPTMGGWHVDGWLSEETGQVVTTALKAIASSQRSAGDGLGTGERMAGALATACHAVLTGGIITPGARIRPHVTITSSLEAIHALITATHPTSTETDSGDGIDGHGNGTDSEAGHALFAGAGESTGCSSTTKQAASAGRDHRIDPGMDYSKLVGVDPARFGDGSPLSPGMLARLVCDSQWARVLFGPDSGVLDVGREQRIHTAGMVRGVIARDEHCQFPGCAASAEFGEIHHSLQWFADAGPTDVEHGILLCWTHHSYVHKRDITITRTDGTWIFTRADGRIITPTPPPVIPDALQRERAEAEPPGEIRSRASSAEKVNSDDGGAGTGSGTRTGTGGSLPADDGEAPARCGPDPDPTGIPPEFHVDLPEGWFDPPPQRPPSRPQIIGGVDDRDTEHDSGPACEPPDEPEPW